MMAWSSKCCFQSCVINKNSHFVINRTWFHFFAGKFNGNHASFSWWPTAHCFQSWVTNEQWLMMMSQNHSYQSNLSNGKWPDRRQWQTDHCSSVSWLCFKLLSTANTNNWYESSSVFVSYRCYWPDLRIPCNSTVRSFINPLPQPLKAESPTWNCESTIN